MANHEEICALRERIDRVLNAIPALKKRLAAQREQAAQKPTRTRRGRRKAPGVASATQLSFFDLQAGDDNQNQAQAG